MAPSACGRRSSLVAILPIIVLAASLSITPAWAQRAAAKSDFEGTQVGSALSGFSPGLTGKGDEGGQRHLLRRSARRTVALINPRFLCWSMATEFVERPPLSCFRMLVSHKNLLA